MDKNKKEEPLPLGDLFTEEDVLQPLFSGELFGIKPKIKCHWCGWEGELCRAVKINGKYYCPKCKTRFKG